MFCIYMKKCIFVKRNKHNVEIMTSKKGNQTEIQRTKAFKKLPTFQQLIMLKSNSVKNIEHAITLIGNIGVEKWEKQSSLTISQKNIIKELITK